MKSNLYFLSNYNTYYNRALKREATLQDYLDKYEQSPAAIANFNFITRDSVNTEIVINTTGETDFHGRYLLVEQGEELSRWFIIETYLIREKQYRLTLRRDLVADFLDPLLESTVYVEKGRLTQNTISIDNINPLVFNQEGFTANQIKKGETLLKDRVGCKWIVGYLNKGYNKKVTDGVPTVEEENKTIVTHTNLGSSTDASVSTAEDLAFLDKYKTTFMRYPVSLTASFNYTQRRIGGIYKIEVGENSFTYSNGTGNAYVEGIYLPDYEYARKYLSGNNYNDMLNYTVAKYPNFVTDKGEWLRVFGLADKTILVRDTGKTYKCKVTRSDIGSLFTTVSQANDPIWYTNLKAYAERGETVASVTDSDFVFSTRVALSEGLRVELVEIENEVYKTIIPTSRNRTLNEAFDAFAIPYVSNIDEQIYVHIQNDILCKVTDATGALAIAQEIMDVGTEALDLQLLPYCPLPLEMISSYQPPGEERTYPILTVTASFNNIEASSIRRIDDVPNNAIFWLTNTQFSTFIEYNDTNDYSSLDKIKAINQLDTWRISSGDYSSSFEFNMARNGGVQYFEVDCAYKPYQPYIHVAPNFGGLYGSDYDDTRGLVCSNTNFSLPRLTDAWETYERNNINYMNAFNRQIKNMEVNRKYQRISEGWGIGTGALTGAASGAVMGSIIPGVGTAIGAAVGTAVGGIASAGAGAIDMHINEQLYKENKQYTIDQFTMSLENIRALPNTLVAVGALNPNNKIFPVLEFYSCSDIEREAFKQKLKWNGMTIGVLTENISDYIDLQNITYFKGQLVYMPLTSVAIDSHEMSELANELAKGILIDKGVI